MINLYEILKKVLQEGVTTADIDNAIENKERVEIRYDDEKNPSHTGLRIIEPYVHGVLGSGNEAIRAYDLGMDTRTFSPKWKTFRIDRILSWEPNGEHFHQPPKEAGYPGAHEYRQDGDAKFASIYKQVKFDQFLSPAERARIERQNAGARKNVNIKSLDPSIAMNFDPYVPERIEDLINQGYKKRDIIRAITAPREKRANIYADFPKEVVPELKRLHKNYVERLRYIKNTSAKRQKEMQKSVERLQGPQNPQAQQGNNSGPVMNDTIAQNTSDFADFVQDKLRSRQKPTHSDEWFNQRFNPDSELNQKDENPNDEFNRIYNSIITK